MKRIPLTFFTIGLLTCTASASWYWPFGGDEDDPPRLSELMEPASLLIDEAGDLAGEGKTDEAVDKYREALRELERIEAENPDRAATPEFASLRNKRAYVNAAIDSMLLGQARENAKAVAVTDTTELEKRFLAKKRGEKAKKGEGDTAAVKKDGDERGDAGAADGARSKTKAKARARKQKRSASEKLAEKLKADPGSRELKLALIGAEIGEGRFKEAKEVISGLLEVNPADASALNLLAACQATEGDTRAAEKTLDQAIQKNPRDYHAYYNMADLRLRAGAAKAAKRYYETGRMVGGPRDQELEKEFE